MATKPKKSHPTTYDIALVRSAAAGRWPEILSALGGVDRSILDGKHHPCPIPGCGGTDRFRLIDEAAGACHCNKCGTKNGDGFSSLSWLTGKDFVHSLRAIADYLNISPSANGSHKNGKEQHDPAEHLEFTEWNEGEELLVAFKFLPRKPGIDIPAIKAIGGRPGMYRGQHKVIAIPVYGPKLDDSEPVGWHLYPTTKAVLPTWTGGKDGKVEWVKSKLTRGSQPGIVGQVDRLKALADIPHDPNGDIQIKSTIWKCEGPSDVLALIAANPPADHIAITNANGCGEKPAKFTWLFERIAGHSVNVIHDADQPGQAGASSWSTAFATLAGETHNVQLPYEIQPTHGKDLRDWLTTEGNSFAGLLELAAAAEPIEQPTADESSAILIAEDDRDPHRLANAFLEARGGIVGGQLALRYWRDEFWRHDGKRYRMVPKGDFSAEVNRFCKLEFDRLAAIPRDDDKKPRINLVTRPLVSNVLAALEGICLLSSFVDFNTWLEKATDDDPEPGKKQWVSMGNGILRLDELLQNADEVLFPHSPNWFSQFSLPYEFELDAECPRWLAFLEKNLEGDQERIAVVQEWAGYLLAESTDEQKFLFCEGEGANGKSVFFAGVEAIVGKESCSHVALEDFEKDFMVAQTNGKIANICADMAEMDRVSEGCLKRLTSGDAVTFNRKHKDPIEVVPTARMMLAANNRPRFTDPTQGLWRRMILVPWRISVAKPERIKGMDKVAWWVRSGELPGMLWWAIEGYLRLKENGDFTHSEVCHTAILDYQFEMNTARAFLNEKYESTEATGYIKATEMYKAYRNWCEQNGKKPVSNTLFGKERNRVFHKSDRRQIGLGPDRGEWAIYGIIEKQFEILPD